MDTARGYLRSGIDVDVIEDKSVVAWGGDVGRGPNEALAAPLR